MVYFFRLLLSILRYCVVHNERSQAVSAHDVKMEKSFSLEETAGFLRGLADTITGEDGKTLDRFGLSLKNVNKIKIGMRWQGDAIDVKMKLNYAKQQNNSEPEKPTTLDSEPGSFKALKKRMKKSFALIGDALKQGQSPSSKELEGFLAAAEKMVSCFGQEDIRYEGYRTLCNAFKVAVTTGDRDYMLRVYKELEVQKKACHDNYK